MGMMGGSVHLFNEHKDCTEVLKPGSFALMYSHTSSLIVENILHCKWKYKKAEGLMIFIATSVSFGHAPFGKIALHGNNNDFGSL